MYIVCQYIYIASQLSPDRSESEGADAYAVHEYPRHDYPKRIVHDRSPEGRLTTTVGFTIGGIPRRFEFQHEGNSMTE